MEWNGVMLPNSLINKLEWQKIRWMIQINEVKCGLFIGIEMAKLLEYYSRTRKSDWCQHFE